MFKRIIVDILITVIVITLFATKIYEMLPMALQLVALKALLVSAGIFHAHIVRKLMFPKINWETDINKAKVYVAIAFYIIIPICYAFGG
jgi:hypothetical protein